MTAIALVLVVVVELVLRVIVPDAMTSVEVEPHPSYLVQLVPGEHRFVRDPANGGEEIHYRVDRHRFRGPDVERARAKQRPRVMVYGDSNVQARFSRLEDTYAVQLQRAIEARCEAEVEVINAGVRGFGPDQVALRLREDLAIWSPDLVIVTVFADNDFGDLLRNKLVRLDDEGRGYWNPEARLPLSGIADLLRRLSVVRVGLSLLARPASPDQAALTAEEMIARLEASSEADYRSYLTSDVVEGPDHYDIDLALVPESDAARTKVALMDHVLGEIMGEVDGHEGTRVYFLILPSSIDASTNWTVSFEDLTRISPAYRRDGMTDRLVRLLERRNADYLDLFSGLATTGESPNYFRAPDNHWNDAGQKLAAELTLAGLHDAGLLAQLVGACAQERAL